MKGSRLFLVLPLLLLGISGCSTNQITEDKLPQLQPGQGMAAVVVDTGEDISQITIIPIKGSGQKLLIPSAPAGQHLYLFVTQADTYCVHSFSGPRRSFYAKSNDQCFDVEPGKLSYGGVYQPFVGFDFYLQDFGAMSHDDDWKNFWELLKSNYPNIAASAFATTETTARETAQTRVPPSTGVCKLLTSTEASTLLGAETDAGVEMSDLVPACAYSNSEQLVVRLTVLRSETMDSKALDDLTPKTQYGWSKPASVPGVGDEARFFARGDTSQLYVVKVHQFMLILTVEGVQRADLPDAMDQAAKIALSRL